jgi:hypothetical protein
LKGADRNSLDNQGNKPIDFIPLDSPQRRELENYLGK